MVYSQDCIRLHNVGNCHDVLRAWQSGTGEVPVLLPVPLGVTGGPAEPNERKQKVPERIGRRLGTSWRSAKAAKRALRPKKLGINRNEDESE